MPRVVSSNKRGSSSRRACTSNRAVFLTVGMLVAAAAIAPIIYFINYTGGGITENLIEFQNTAMPSQFGILDMQLDGSKIGCPRPPYIPHSDGDTTGKVQHGSSSSNTLSDRPTIKEETKMVQPHQEEVGNKNKSNHTQSSDKHDHSHHPDAPLFLDRLNQLLPLPCSDIYQSQGWSGSNITARKNNTKVGKESFSERLFPSDIQKIERKLLQFHIPRPVHLRLFDSSYISIQYYRWLFRDQEKTEEETKQCPNCHVHFHRWNGTRGPLPDGRIADVRVHQGCPRALPVNYREAPWQILIGGCGESQAGSGERYFKEGRRRMDYDASFLDDGGPFATTFAHLHLSPNNSFGFPELWNVTSFTELLLRPPPTTWRAIYNNSSFSAVFVHNDCRHSRGKLLKELADTESQHGFRVARPGACFRNTVRPPLLAGWDGVPCPDLVKKLHNDCEATRDGIKTVLSSLHNFTFSLENTLSKDYITEKRWQALLGGSIPIVWDNDNSEDSLPDRDAAVLVRPGTKGFELGALLHRIASDPDEYASYFAWKKRGLRPEFVRKLFLSADYIYCRICEYVAAQPPTNTSFYHSPNQSDGEPQ